MKSNKNDIVSFGKIKESNEYNFVPESLLSANTFFHYVDKIKYLYEILEDKKLYPRYVLEDYSRLHIGFNEIRVAEKCFCDIPLHLVKEHRKEYGKYCIGLSRYWGISHGLQPVIYYNPCDEFVNKISLAYKKASDLSENMDDVEEVLNHYLKFCKPYFGIDLKTNKTKILMDEKEWRYVPDISNMDFTEIIQDNDREVIESYNELIKERYYLDFEYSDIKYIICDTNKQARSIIKRINNFNLDVEIKNLLISKIFSWEDVGGDV